MIGGGGRIGVRNPARLFAAAGLLAAQLAGNLQLHNHSISAGDPGVAASGDRFLTRHNPLSHASHLHAVIATVHDDDCVTCHIQRISQAHAASCPFQAPSPSRSSATRPRHRPRCAGRPSSEPRAPPVSSR